jgi:hypothetical protein
MATEQDPGAQARVAEIEGLRAQLKSQAIASALSKHDLQPGAAEQIELLVGSEFSLTKGFDGRELVVGPGYQPLEVHVADVLQRPDFVHFLRSKQPASPTATVAPTEVVAPTAAVAPTEFVRVGGQESALLPGETLGAAIIRLATMPQPTRDPLLDPSQPLAWGARSLKRR